MTSRCYIGSGNKPRGSVCANAHAEATESWRREDRRRVVRDFFVEVLGIPPETGEEKAHLLGDAVGPEALARMIYLLALLRR
ncbi:MAG: hypothetical protein AB1776_07560 [Bacillota bacterium]